jgi:hypothetical protein
MGSILLGNPLALSEASTRFAHLLSFARLLHVLFSYAISLRITWVRDVLGTSADFSERMSQVASTPRLPAVSSE